MNPLLVLNLLLAIGGLGLLIVTIFLYVDYFIYKGNYLTNKIKPFLWSLIILTTSGSVALSLLYSEYFGFIPCSLCWLQRIGIYPQALLALLAFKTKDTLSFPIYGIGLSIFGLLVAIYQYIYQLIPAGVRDGLVPCLADGGADCGVKVIDVFGFVTFPFLSAATFLFLIILYLYLLKTKSSI